MRGMCKFEECFSGGVRGRWAGRSLWMVLMVVAVLAPAASAVPYFGEEVFTYHQPDGSTFGVRLYGDEFFAYQRTADEGREVVLDEATGFWCYAKLAGDGRSFVSTGAPVITRDKSSLVTGKTGALSAGAAQPLQTLPLDVVMALAKARKEAMGAAARELLAPTGIVQEGEALAKRVGPVVGLCILVDFPDEEGVISRGDVGRFLNEASGYSDFGNACSVNEYFHIESNGKLDYTNIVTPWVRMPHPKFFYDDNSIGGGKASLLVQTALEILDQQGFDFGTVDAINIFYAGTRSSGWMRGLWPHSTGFYQMTDMGNSLTLGTFCHENGHLVCGFPDLYSYTASYLGTSASIVGWYCLMGGGGGKHPPHFAPILKYIGNWAEIVEVPYDTLPMNALLQADRNRFYKYTNPDRPTEFYLLENRNDTGYEGPYGGAGATAPGRGLVVWHVDQTGSNKESSIQDPTVPKEEIFKTPYYAFVIEAEPGATTPWYANPSPLPDEKDTFYFGHGADPVYSYPPLPYYPIFGVTDPNNPDKVFLSNPDLCFWDRDDLDAGRTIVSKLAVHSFGAQGHFMPFVIGVNPLGRADWEVLGVGGSPEIAVTCSSIVARCNWGQNPPSQSFRVYNAGGQGTLYFEVTSNHPWLLVSPGSGYAKEGGEDFTVSFDATSLAPGTYMGTITIVSEPAAAPLNVNVTLNVAERHVLVVTPPELNVNLTYDAVSTDYHVDVLNDGGGSMKYTVSSSCSGAPWNWLEPTLTSSLCVANMTEAVYLNIRAIDLAQNPPVLPVGTYEGTVTVTAPGALNSPANVTVNLTVGGFIRLLSPNGGEVWQPNKDLTVPIEWAANVTDPVNIQLMKWDSVASEYVVVEDIASGLAYDGDPDADGRSRYDWSLPLNMVPGGDYRVRIFTGADWDTSTCKDESDADIRIYRVAYSTDMSEDPQGTLWTFEGGWAWGVPAGGGAADGVGNPDPSAGYSGSTVVGYNLEGNYENSMAGTEYAVLGPINCTDFADTRLTFRRWLGVEKTDSAVLEISTNGTAWSQLWGNPLDEDITDGDGGVWELVTYDISQYADQHLRVWFRWSMGPTDSLDRFCGWNLDDVAVYGVYLRVGSIDVTILPPEAISDGAQWRRVGTSQWLDSVTVAGAIEGNVPAGTHEIEFKDAAGWWRTPDNVTVTVNYGQQASTQATYRQAGFLTATLTPPGAVAAGAQWRRAGTTQWLDSGATEEQVLPGAYTVEFKPVAGWTTPPSQPVSIAFNQLSATSGDYVLIPTGSLLVTIEPAGAVTDGARWRRVGTATWLESGVSETGIPVGTYNIEFKSVANWATPAQTSVTIVGGETASKTGTYVPLGSLHVTLSPTEAPGAGAQWRWRPAGGDDTTWSQYFNSGQTDPNVPAGNCELEFKELNPDYWDTPLPKTVAIVFRQTTNEVGVYLGYSRLRVTIQPAEAVTAGAQWRRVGQPTWLDSGATEPEVPVGECTIEFKSLPGWDTPANKTVTTILAQLTDTSVTYVGYGSLKVTITPEEAVTDGAQWRRVGQPTWRDSGTTESDVPTGPCSVEFKSINGWGTPSNKTVTIIHGEESSTTGQYYRVGALKVNITPAEAVTAGAQWRRSGQPAWLNSGETEQNVPVGSQTIEFKPIDGWGAPQNQIADIKKGEIFTADAQYVRVGSLKVTITPAAAVTAGAQWRRKDTLTWFASGATETNVPEGPQTVEFSEVTGWVKPANASATVEAGKIATASGTYTEITVGSLHVTITPQAAVSAGAQWRRVGQTTWLNSDATETDVPMGSCRVEFKAIEGWYAPATQTVTIPRSETAEAAGTYEQIAYGSLQVLITPAGAVSAGAQWRRSGTTDWFDSGETERNLPEGNYTVEFKALEGWRTPQSQMVSVVEGETAAATGVYVEIIESGSLQVMIEPVEARLAGAQWRRAGTTTWRNGSYIESDVPIGDYVIEFSAVEGWLEPGDIAVTIELDERTTATGTYEKATGALQVAIMPQGARDDGAMWRRIGAITAKTETEVTSGNVFRIGAPVLNGAVLEVPLLLFRGDDVTSQDIFSKDGLFADGPAPAVFGFDVVYDPSVLYFSNGQEAGVEESGQQTGVTCSDNLTNWYGHEVSVSEPDGSNAGRVRLVFMNSVSNAPVTTRDNVRSGGNPGDAQNPFLLGTMYFDCSLDADASVPLLIQNVVASDGEQMLDAVEAQSAVFKLDTGSDWLPSGAIETDIAPGTYTVEFKDVVGWTTPNDEEVDVVGGETASATGTYVEIPSGSLLVTITPPEAVAAGAQWRRTGTAQWLDSGSTEEDVPEGSHVVEFQTVSGWNTPENQTVAITAGETTTAAGAYTEIVPAGSLWVVITPQEAVDAGAQWRRVGTAEWRDSGFVEEGVPAGLCTVEFQVVSGWNAPENIDVPVEVGDTALVTGAYTAQDGSGCPWVSKAFQPFAETTVFEPVLPSAQDENGMRLCAPLAPLAIRLRSSAGIAADSVWGTVSWGASESENVLWLPLDADQADGWAVYQPETPWAVNEIVTFTAGAYTVSGQAIGPFTYEFVVSDAVYAGSAAIAESDETADRPEFVGFAYEIYPGTAYDEPVTIQLPVPDGVDASALEPAYLFYKDGQGTWVSGTKVDGWLEPGSVRAVQTADGVYVEFQVRHGGVVQLQRRPVGVSSAGVHGHGISGDLLLFAALGAYLLCSSRVLRLRRPV